MANKLAYYRMKHRMTTTELGRLATNSQHHAVTFHEKNHLSAKAAIKYAKVLNENPFSILDSDVLTLMPKTQEDKEILLRVISSIEVKE